MTKCYGIAPVAYLRNRYNGLSHDMIVRTFGMDNDEFYEWATCEFHGRGFNYVKPMEKLTDEETDKYKDYWFNNENIVNVMDYGIYLLRGRLVDCLDVNYVIDDVDGYIVLDSNGNLLRHMGEDVNE